MTDDVDNWRVAESDNLRTTSMFNFATTSPYGFTSLNTKAAVPPSVIVLSSFLHVRGTSSWSFIPL